MSATLRSERMMQLDRRPEPDEQVPEEDTKDPARLARLLMRILRDVAGLKRRWWPRRLDHEDITLDATGTATFPLPHGFGGRVRYWPVEWSGAAAPCIIKHASTSADVLVITSLSAGTATIRVEEAG